MSTIKAIFIGILTIVGILALAFCLEYFNLVGYRFFGIRYQDNQRKIYEHSQSYVEGKKNDINRSMLELKSSKDKITRLAIKNMVAHSFSEFNEDDPSYNLTSEEKDFLKDMKYSSDIDTLKYPYPRK